MQSVYEWFVKIIQKFKTWYYHFILSEATKAEIDEWFEEQERQRAEEEADEAMWLADYTQQQEQVLADKIAEEEEYALRDEEDRKFEKEFEERERLIELLRNEQEEDRYRCPLCGTRWLSLGRCKPCDRACGHD